MISHYLGPVVLGGVLLCISLGLAPAGQTGNPRSQAADNGNAFALDLYSRLKEQPGNLFFSPYSISTCLAMTYAGARGETEAQMAKVLHFDKDQHRLHAALGELQRELRTAQQQSGVQLNIANALWTQNQHPFVPAFLQVAQKEYQANINQADFKTAAEAARDQINQWVDNQTKGKIKDILPPGSIDSVTRLVLANAIYFKGIWTVPFTKEQTSPQPFYLSAGRKIEVPLMHHVDEVRYMENGQLQAVELPYSSNRFSMLVLLPRGNEGCTKMENGLTPGFIGGVLQQMKKQKVELFLPRFTMESSLNLDRDLVKMGMTDAFGSRADFSGIDGTRLLYISAIYHKAWVEVNEEGTEAAAATATTITTLAIHKPPPPPPVFRADHPFAFLIRDTQSGMVLFLGRLGEPKSNP